jgi:hypothetical protein
MIYFTNKSFLYEEYMKVLYFDSQESKWKVIDILNGKIVILDKVSDMEIMHIYNYQCFLFYNNENKENDKIDSKKRIYYIDLSKEDLFLYYYDIKNSNFRHENILYTFMTSYKKDEYLNVSFLLKINISNDSSLVGIYILLIRLSFIKYSNETIIDFNKVSFDCDYENISQNINQIYLKKNKSYIFKYIHKKNLFIISSKCFPVQLYIVYIPPFINNTYLNYFPIEIQGEDKENSQGKQKFSRLVMIRSVENGLFSYVIYKKTDLRSNVNEVYVYSLIDK